MTNRIFAALLVLCLAACASTSAPGGGTGTAARLDHVAIHVANAETSAMFYKDVFGLAEIKNPFVGGGGVVWLDLGNGTALHLFGGRKTPIVNERERHFAFTVSDMSRVTDHLRLRGMSWQDFDGLIGRVQTRPDGIRQLFFQDPDGYWIEVNDALKR